MSTEKPINPNAEYRSQVDRNIYHFYQNWFIQQIAMQPKWTISTTDKKPIDFHKFLQEGQTYTPLYKDGVQLPTLYEIDMHTTYQQAYKTYRVNNEHPDYFIIVIDIEKYASEECVQRFMQLPLHYAEYSHSGGIHACIAYPRAYMTEDLQMLEHLNQCTNKQEEYEYFFNKHFITFTHKVIPTAPVDMSQGSYHMQTIHALLKSIVKQNIQNERYYQEKAKQTSHIAHSEGKEQFTETEEKFIQYIEETYQTKLHELTQQTPQDYAGNRSQYEYNIAMRVAGMVWTSAYRNKNPFLFARIGKKPKDFTVDECIYMAHYLFVQLIEPREKHEQYRCGMKWCLYLTHEAFYNIHYKNQASVPVLPTK